MNKTLAKLIGHLQLAGKRALDANGSREDQRSLGLTAFELEDRILYSATPVDFIDAQPEPVDINEMLPEAPELAAMSATLPTLDLVISTVGNASTSGGDGWQGDDAVFLSDPDLSLGSDTDASFYDFFDLDDFTSNNVSIRGLHAIQHDFTMGTGSNSFDLKVGDLVFATSGNGTLTGNSTSISTDADVYVFRPDSPGVYDSGEFYFLLDNPLPGVFAGVTIVDKPGGVNLPDGTSISQGTVLLGATVFSFDLIQGFLPTDVGEGTTAGLTSTVVFGSSASVGINEPIDAIHIVPEDMVYGGATFNEGDILFSLERTDPAVGTSSTPLDRQDIGLLRFDAGGDAQAIPLFDGSDVGLSSNSESVNSITFAVANTAPTGISIDNSSIDENTDTSSGVAIGTLSASDDKGGPFTFEVVGASPFSVSGDQLILTGEMLDFETTAAYPVVVRATDPGGLSVESTLNILVNNVNEAPAIMLQNTLPSINENGTPLLSPTKVADILVTDDSLGSETLILSGFDSSMFEIVGTELFLKAGELIDFETNPSLDVVVSVDDPMLGTGPEAAASHLINVVDVNEAPSINVANQLTQIDENTAAQTKVADIVVLDDVPGNQTVSLTGVDANYFEIIGNSIFLKAGQDVDFETNPILDVSVEVDDPTIGSTFEDVKNLSIAVRDINEAPEFYFDNVVPSIPEDTTIRTKVADLVVVDDAIGSETFTLSGDDAGHFEIIGNELFVRANAGLDFETNPVLDIFVAIDDSTIGSDVEDTDPLSILVSDVIEGPSVSLINKVSSLPEDYDTSTRTRIADIVVDNDPMGSANLLLAGADAIHFEIDGTQLYLKANVSLDFETQSHFDVVVQVDDPAVGTTFDDQATHVLGVGDINEAPSIALVNVIPAIAENTVDQTKVADIVITDDALGTETLTLDGSHKDLFEIVGTELYLKAGQDIDFESAATLAVTIKIDDPSLGTSDDGADNINVGVVDVNEAPTVQLVNLLPSIDENTSVQTKVADIVVIDDALGSESLSLSGPDANFYQIIGNELYIRAGQDIDFERELFLNAFISVDDPTLGTGRDDILEFDIAINDVNEAPTVDLINTLPSISEFHDTSTRTKIADIQIADDDLGAEALILSGADSDKFEIVGTELYLKANTALDFESSSSLEVTVSIDDVTLGTGAEDFDSHSLAVIDENEAPSVQLVNKLTTISEDTSIRTKVADIVVSDDASGTETLSLTGSHANLFEIDGAELYLIANAGLDFESMPQLDVTIEIDDASIGSGPEDSDSQFVAVGDINEAPQVDDPVEPIAAVEDDPDVVVDLAGVFSDVDGDSLTLSIGAISDPGIISASLNGNMLNIDFLADQSGTLTIDIVASDGEYEATSTITVNVEAANDAPVIAGNLALADVYRDSDPAGELIQDVVGTAFSDIDGDSLMGIAIISSDAPASEGIWQVKGSSNEWRDVTGVDVTAAKLVPITSSIRFLPAPGFAGTPTPIEFVAIDSSYSGRRHGNIDVSSSGGITPFSADAFEIGINVRQFGVEVTPTSPLVTEERGRSATFEVVLEGAPSGDVVIPVGSSDNSEGQTSTNQLTFTPSNWSTPQTVTVVGVDEFVDDGNQSYSVEFGSVMSIDPQYDGLATDSMNYVNLDDDEAAVVLSDSNLQTNENGDADQFDVKLGSQPTSDVTLELKVSDETEAGLSANVVHFTPDNWNVPQTVTVTGQNDQIPDDDTNYVITATPISGDPNFDSLSPVEINAENAAAIGPVSTIAREPVEAPIDDTEDGNEPVFIDPSTGIRTTTAERGGVDDVESKPRAFLVGDSAKEQEEESDDRFVASHHWRPVEKLGNENFFHSNRATVVEEIVNEITRNENFGMSDLWSDLDQLEERIAQEGDAPLFAAGAAASIASVFTAGYLVWLIRGGWVLAGLLSQRAMWTSFNVLAVLNQPDEDDKESKSLESLVNDPQTEQRSPAVDEIENAEMTQVSV